MAKHLKDPVDEEQEIKDAFKLFDRNCDGYVYEADIKYVMSLLGTNIRKKTLNHECFFNLIFLKLKWPPMLKGNEGSRAKKAFLPFVL